jgi:hypothetical protein
MYINSPLRGWDLSQHTSYNNIHFLSHTFCQMLGNRGLPVGLLTWFKNVTLLTRLGLDTRKSSVPQELARPYPRRSIAYVSIPENRWVNSSTKSRSSLVTTEASWLREGSKATRKSRWPWTSHGSGSQMEILSSILQFKLVRNPAEELLCLVLIFIMSVVALKTNQSRTVRSHLRIRAAVLLCILHPQYKSFSTVSCLQKIRILTLIFGRCRQFRLV